MHHEVTKALYESYSLEHKNDFFPAYVYLKYIEHFMSHVLQSLGIPTKELPDQVDEGISDMIEAVRQQIADAAPSAETSVYHAKVVKLQDAVKLVTQKENLNLPLSERVVPFKVARDIVLNTPDSIALGTCPCRSVSENPCLPPPQEVCLFVGDPWASFIGEQSQKFRKISQEEAVKVLEESHRRGFVHCAYFKKELGNSFAALCNCCSCCCLGIKMWNLLEGTVPILAPSGYVSEVSDECNGCDVCVEKTCPFNAISMDEDAGKATVNHDKCMGCGVCVDVCPIAAINLRPEPSKGEPLDLEELKSSARTA